MQASQAITNSPAQAALPLAYTRLLFRHLGLNEHNCSGFFNGSKLTYSDLMTLDAKVSFADQRPLFQNAIALSGDEFLGLSIGQQLQLSTHGLLGSLLATAHQFGDALELLCQFGMIREPFFQFQLRPEKNRCCLTLIPVTPLLDLNRFLTEAVVCSVVSATQLLTNGQGLMEVRFNFDAPPDVERYATEFQCAVIFNAPATSLVFSKHCLTAASPTADSEAHVQFLVHCQNQRQAHAAQLNYTHQVQHLLEKNPGKIWTLQDIASQLHTSTRTLIRKLKMEGENFQCLRDKTLCKQAQLLLGSQHLSVDSVAHLIGFSDVASFRRSFKRWTGKPPNAFRTRP